MDTSIKVGALFIFLLIGFGIYQAYTDDLPSSSLAGAVTEKSQEQINGCMKDCMRGCVSDEATVEPCRQQCEAKCW